MPIRFTVVSWPGDEEQDAGREQLALGQPVALLLGGDERGQEVGARVPAPLGQERAEVVRDAPAGRRARARRSIGSDGMPMASRLRVMSDGPLLDRLVIARRHAEHLGDDGDRQGIGQVADHVHRPRRSTRSSSPSTTSWICAAQALDHPRGERPTDERAQARVVRRIAEEHGAGQAAGLGLLAVLGRQDGLEAVAAEARIAQRRDAVVVAREHPEAERAQVDRIALAQALVERDTGWRGTPAGAG